MKHAERSFVKDKQFPDDVQMLFCIGAQKAGTTWLFHLLRESKHIHFTKNKELHYFDVIYGKAKQLHEVRINAVKMLAHKLGNEIGAYNDNHLDALIDLSQLLRIYSNHDGNHQAYVSYLLNDHSDQDVIADITPAYAILDRAGFTEMGRIGCAKFIFILRDPVDRMWSQIRMAVGSQNHQAESFQRACEQRARHLIANNRLANIERGNYQRTIEELESAIPLNRIKYIFYENLFSENTIFDICEELEVRCHAQVVTVDKLKTADEVFITSTAGGVMPVTRIDKRPIASGNIGPLSKQIMDAYWQMHNEGKHRDPVKY